MLGQHGTCEIEVGEGQVNNIGFLALVILCEDVSRSVISGGRNCPGKIFRCGHGINAVLTQLARRKVWIDANACSSSRVLGSGKRRRSAF